MRTVRQQHLEQVAGCIYDAMRHSHGLAIDLDFVKRQNYHGWAFEICYDGQEYSEGWYTRVSDYSVTEEDEPLVYAMALELASVLDGSGGLVPEQLPVDPRAIPACYPDGWDWTGTTAQERVESMPCR